jgi:hypothetical protein
MMLMTDLLVDGRLYQKPSQLNVNYKVAYAYLVELHHDYIHQSSGYLFCKLFPSHVRYKNIANQQRHAR